jgi:hypothetical protein
MLHLVGMYSTTQSYRYQAVYHSLCASGFAERDNMGPGLLITVRARATAYCLSAAVASLTQSHPSGEGLPRFCNPEISSLHCGYVAKVCPATFDYTTPLLTITQ